ncbi:hypothetical protein CPB83DRAFT_815371 [Crepidotus variabilis]|uniref:Glycoside hydrolase 131 catalytic N-terminal domain-containing protein n=1 Tax=Crepidotus variabilis TaxID=179855 RepID=A0A9P6EET5_9AGAR|nr:hypothetical protein CPB83DRAFT_815371 [Crepidotus variabilis]
MAVQVAITLFAFIVLTTAKPPSPITCPIVFDGRVAKNLTLQDFDTDGLTPYQAGYVHGVNLTWSKIVQFPKAPPSKFDSTHDKAVEVTISDGSLFQPGGGQVQTGFRRAGFLLGANNGSDASNVGVKTFHWSVKQDQNPRMGMNLTHEYMNVWHETNDYSHNQFSFKAGVVLFVPKSNQTNKRTWKITNYKDEIVWSTPIDFEDWQNFAVTLDYNKSTLQIYYSQGNDPLRVATHPLPNDNSGGGQFQIGVAKKPTETQGVVYDGYQETHIHEGQIYGGIFVEDSSGGCVSGSKN